MENFVTLKCSLLFLFLIQIQGYAQEVIEKSYSGITKVEVDVSGIDVSYVGSSTSTTVGLKAMLGVNENPNKNLVLIKMGNTLKVGYKKYDKQKVNNEKRFIQIEGPETITLQVKNTSGQTQVRNVHSDETKVVMNSGNTKISGVFGDLSVKGNSGRLDLSNLHGNLTCSMNSGTIEVADVFGNVSLSSNSGSIKARNVEGRFDGKVNSGQMKLDDVMELGELKVSSGSIRVQRGGLGPSTTLQGSSGLIDIITESPLEDFNFELNAGSGVLVVGEHTKVKNLIVQNGSPHTIKGNINSGSIKIQNR
jgi:lia operon protein LiaG